MGPQMRKMTIATAAAVLLLLPVGAGYYLAHADLALFFTPYRGGERLPSPDVVLQNGPRSCGLAALSMLLSLAPSDSARARIERLLIPSEQGVSLRALQLAALAVGRDVKTWYVVPSDLPQLPLPAIGMVNNQHFVVVERFQAPAQVVIVDPALGRVRLPLQRFQKIWSGPALLLHDLRASR